MFDFLLDFFINPMNIAFIGMFTVIGVLVGYVFQPSPKNQILYCRERDGRAEQFDIQSEDAISIVTKTDPPLRFYKYGKGYVTNLKRPLLKKTKRVNRFFAKEGTAYTYKLEGTERIPTKFVEELQDVIGSDGKPMINPKNGKPFKEKVKVATEFEDKNISLDFPTLADAVKYKLGEAYREVPEEIKQVLTENNVLVTVGLEAGLTPEGYKPITETVIYNKADQDMASLLASRIKGAIKKSAIDYLPWIGSGIAIGMVLYAIGILS